MNNTYLLITIAIITVVTQLTRFLPFLIFSGNKKTPPFLNWLGKVLPYAVMGMLVVYCLKNVAVTLAPYGLPELIGVLVAVVTHVLKRNASLSIFLSTAVYMLILNLF